MLVESVRVAWRRSCRIFLSFVRFCALVVRLCCRLCTGSGACSGAKTSVHARMLPALVAERTTEGSFARVLAQRNYNLSKLLPSSEALASVLHAGA